MGFNACGKCGHVFTKKDGDVPHADGGFMEVNRGGGVCKDCYVQSGRSQCSNCKDWLTPSWQFCPMCGTSKHPPAGAVPNVVAVSEVVRRLNEEADEAMKAANSYKDYNNDAYIDLLGQAGALRSVAKSFEREHATQEGAPSHES